MSLKGSFKNYIDKMKWVGGQKCLLLSTFNVKNLHGKLVVKKGKNHVHVVIEWVKANIENCGLPQKYNLSLYY